ncbi:beta,beta-carotene 15,15'-dioxygenase-like, partial [Sander vitreus]
YPDPCSAIFSRTLTHLRNLVPDFTDNNLVNIVRYGRDYYASSEVNYINQIDPVTLETIGRTNYRNHISLNLATAHPHYDDEGNTYNMGTAIMGFGLPKYLIFKVPADTSDKEKKQPVLRRVQKVGSIRPRSLLSPSYFHSFAMTQNHFVLVEQPLRLDIIKLATAYIRGVTLGSCLRFDKDETTLFHVINRNTGKAVSTRFYGDALVVFHHVNAYEEDGHVVLDLISYQNSNLYDMFYIQNLRQDTSSFIQANRRFSPPVCQRFVMPLHAHAESPRGSNMVTLTDTTASALMQEDGSVYCRPETLFEGLELPAINYKFNAKKYRYFYGSRLEWSPHPNKMAKVDIVSRKHVEWFQENCFPSEPVFVASPGATEEDDGEDTPSTRHPHAVHTPSHNLHRHPPLRLTSLPRIHRQSLTSTAIYAIHPHAIHRRPTPSTAIHTLVYTSTRHPRAVYTPSTRSSTAIHRRLRHPHACLRSTRHPHAIHTLSNVHTPSTRVYVHTPSTRPSTTSITAIHTPSNVHTPSTRCLTLHRHPHAIHRSSHAIHTPSTRRPHAIHTPSTRRPHAIHTPSTRRPHAIHTLSNVHTPSTRRPHAVHTPSTRRLTPSTRRLTSTRHPHAIHTPSTRHPHAV